MVELSILVCDDSETVRKQMIEALHHIGIKTVLEACDGFEAVEMCHVNQPNIIFMDIIMPNKDGISALKEIHQIYPDIKVVMASSTSGQAHLKKSVHLGAFGFIRKPIDETTLRNIIDKYYNELTDSTSNV
ncbi:response regulator [Evansella tamaricis]|uniref:Response regulator n=1 Tax=Evansella tamaricis TaxID=2069301 RepID=A0ABS6JHL6_9BACI|nr:response regulator [Evansella tamaricis]MBU9713159.1 response regulator [Evansella tamaricis]